MFVKHQKPTGEIRKIGLSATIFFFLQGVKATAITEIRALFYMGFFLTRAVQEQAPLADSLGKTLQLGRNFPLDNSESAVHFVEYEKRISDKQGAMCA